MSPPIIALVAGIAAGVVTGLLPGIHTNLIAAVVVSASVVLQRFFSSTELGVFIISMSIVNAVVSAVPSIYLGAPETEYALGVLPGHRMLLQGKGYEAVALTALGSFWSLTTVILSAPLLLAALVYLNAAVAGYIGIILAAISIFMILREGSPLAALFVFLLSGALGIAVLNGNVREPLFPLLSGMFGISTLVASFNEKVNIPEQKIDRSVAINRGSFAATVTVASVVGTLVGFFPGVGPAQAAVIGSQALPRKSRNFLVLVGGISSANMIGSILTFYVLDKARNGAIVAVRELLQSITLQQLVIFLLVSFISGCIGFVLTLMFAEYGAKLLVHVNYRLLSIGVILFIAALVPVLSGWMGIPVLIVSTLVGMLPPLLGVSRSEAMGCLLLPVILWFVL